MLYALLVATLMGLEISTSCRAEIIMVWARNDPASPQEPFILTLRIYLPKEWNTVILQNFSEFDISLNEP